MAFVPLLQFDGHCAEAPEGRHTAVFRQVADAETGDLPADLLMDAGGFPIVPWGPAA